MTPYRPDTSQLAFEYARPRMASNRWIALRALVDAGAEGLSDFDLERVTGIKQTSIGKRRGELIELGLVEMAVAGGKPVRRRAPSGALAQVWRVTAAGVQAVWEAGA